MDKWDARFLRLAREVSTWSKDPSKQIGAVAVRDRRPIAVGYNGPTWATENEEELLHDHTWKTDQVIHAEQNLIYNAAAEGVSLKGADIFVWGLPSCWECCKALCQNRVFRVSCVDLFGDPRWSDPELIKKIGKKYDDHGIAFVVYNTQICGII